MGSSTDLFANNGESLRAAFTAFDQTYGKTAEGYILQPIDNSGNGRTQPWQTPPGWTITKSVEDKNWNGKFVVYQNQVSGDTMLVPMGTNGNKDAIGWRPTQRITG